MIKPLFDNVLLKAKKVEEKTKSGIFLTNQENHPQEGVVVAVGERVVGVKIDDKVFFRKYAPDEIKVDGEEYLLTREEDLLAIIN